MLKEALILASLSGLTQGQTFTITLDSNDFGVTPVFNSVSQFHFVIEVDEPLQAGVTYSNPTLSLVDYSVFGNLPSGSPSGFPAFNLARTMTGTEFYAQGSSLNFTVAAGANLADGLQMSELTGSAPAFVLNAREVNTGRYHPPLFELSVNGTGVLQNSNNFGATTTNPSTGQLVNVDFGDEYITNLTFDPATTTIAVPEPTSSLLVAASLITGILRRRRA